MIEGMAEFGWLALLLLICLAGVLLTAFQLPGTWLIFVAAVGYDWLNQWERLGGRALLILAGIAGVCELIEAISSAYFSHRAGGSRRAAIFSVIGGIAGALLLSVPVPVFGALVGAALGCFVGAVAAELSLERPASDSVRVGVWSAVGRTIGSMIKLIGAVMMSALLLGAAIRAMF